MPFDMKPSDLPVRVDTERARFAADLAKHMNEPYGLIADAHHCALARFFGGEQPDEQADDWRWKFVMRYDGLGHQPTGFDCLAILNSIP